jgi:hypothetical protein
MRCPDCGDEEYIFYCQRPPKKGESKMEKIIRTIAVNSIIKAKEQKKNPYFENKKAGHVNKILSSIFVSELGQMIFNELINDKANYQLNVIKVFIEENKISKKGGEWLFDVSIVKTRTVEEPYSGKTVTKQLYEGLEWAIESEFDPGLESFTEDFSKLLVVKTKIVSISMVIKILLKHRTILKTGEKQ